ncbi:MAG TPA: RsmE family RNA methyltransferase [Candidatus Dormibacteraeota bacterium]|nr:RsmE family RNA methyltransferase [Candidatus Dormibacteraeota bacterium]
MTRRRWIADEVKANRASLIGAHADHLVRVLRARVGQEFDIVAGPVIRRGRVAAIADGRVDFELAEEIASGVAVPSLTLLLAIFKFDRMEWAIEKAAELGVSRIIPIVARRSEAHLAAASAKRAERWRRIALQAAEQSRRSAPPEIADPIKLREGTALPGQLKIVLSESEQRSQLADILAAQAKDEVLLAVGPEGGWTDDEMQVFQEAGWISASLGPTILRAETAAIAAVAITMSELSR